MKINHAELIKLNCTKSSTQMSN